MSLPTYPKYKDSGVEWLGTVPEHWNTVPLKAVTTHNDEVLDEKTEPSFEIVYVDISSVSLASGIESKEVVGFENAPSRARRKVRDGDVIVSTVRTYLRSIACIRDPEPNLIVSTGFAVVRPTQAMISGFLGHLMTASYFIEEVIARSTGVSYPAINASELVSIPVVIPPLAEQQAIKSFLDRETSKIDALVAEQQKLIELLKEKRQAVISHAVTKGLNPDAPMKDSGIEWLGMVPEHWVLGRVKFASCRISKGDTPSNFGMEFALDGPVRFIKIENIGEGELIETPRYSIDFDAHNQLARSQLRANDIVFAIAGATTGKCAIVRPHHLPANTNQAVAYIRPNSTVEPPYLVAWLQNPRLLEAMWEMTSQSAQPNLSMENLGNLPIPLPPKHEQFQIVQFLGVNGNGYQTLISEAHHAIELLQERRAALISAAVTGKIDVRQLATKEAS